jgi:hypothetical protein
MQGEGREKRQIIMRSSLGRTGKGWGFKGAIGLEMGLLRLLEREL